MFALVLISILIWLFVMIVLWTPSGFYSSALDRLTKARWRDDRVGLQIMLDHLKSFPDQWSISREGASFPKEGMKQIYLTYDDRSGWEYTLNSFGGKARPLAGHFRSEFVRELTAENNRRESQALLRTFYPELDGPLLLAGNK